MSISQIRNTQQCQVKDDKQTKFKYIKLFSLITNEWSHGHNLELPSYATFTGLLTLSQLQKRAAPVTDLHWSEQAVVLLVDSKNSQLL